MRSVGIFGLQMSRCEQGYHQRWKGCEKSCKVAARLRKDLRNERITHICVGSVSQVLFCFDGVVRVWNFVIVIRSSRHVD